MTTSITSDSVYARDLGLALKSDEEGHFGLAYDLNKDWDFLKQDLEADLKLLFRIGFQNSKNIAELAKQVQSPGEDQLLEHLTKLFQLVLSGPEIIDKDDFAALLDNKGRDEIVLRVNQKLQNWYKRFSLEIDSFKANVIVALGGDVKELEKVIINTKLERVIQTFLSKGKTILERLHSLREALRLNFVADGVHKDSVAAQEGNKELARKVLNLQERLTMIFTPGVFVGEEDRHKAEPVIV